MASRNTENLALLTDLHLKQGPLSEMFSHVGLSAEQSINLIDQPTNQTTDRKVFSLTHVPDYIKTIVSNSAEWTERIFPSVNGYAIHLNKYSNVDDYLRNQNKKQRENITRALRRLETCFNITYRMFGEDIKEEEYQFLMATLKEMITKRFEQRSEKSNTLAVWEKVLSTSFELIKNQKASLFVIYDKNRPIAISFNYHYDALLFGYISSYNIDYSKFSPGQLIIYKLLEWCFNNQYTQYDMGWGDLEYKKWWCNGKYRFNHHIFYPKHNIAGFFYALLKGNMSRIMAFLISKGVNTYWKKIKNMLKVNTIAAHYSPQYRFETIILLPSGQWKEIDLHQENLPIAKKIINDFLYMTREYSNDVTLHYSEAKDTYILKGKKALKAIQINPANQ